MGRATSWGPCSSPEPPEPGGGSLEPRWGCAAHLGAHFPHIRALVSAVSKSLRAAQGTGKSRMVPGSPRQEQQGEWMSLWEEWDGEGVSPSQAGGHRGAQTGDTRVNPVPEAPPDLGSLPAVTPIPA